MRALDPSSPFDGEWGIPSFYAIGGNTLRGLARRKPSRLLVLGDVFHPAYADAAIDCVFAVMALAPQHTFQVLTKRPMQMLDYFLALDPRPGVLNFDRIGDAIGQIGDSARWREKIGWPLPNVWLGVSVEDQVTADARIPLLLKTPAAHRFVSYEPAIGPVEFDRICIENGATLGTFIDATRGHRWDESAHEGGGTPCHRDPPDGPRIDWLIVGGESGPGARPFDVSWARAVVRDCRDAGVPCFVKQLGARPICSAFPLPVQQSAESIAAHGEYDPDAEVLRLKSRKGSDPSEWPADLRVREVPACG